jgi:hypothetical protein
MQPGEMALTACLGRTILHAKADCHVLEHHFLLGGGRAGLKAAHFAAHATSSVQQGGLSLSMVCMFSASCGGGVYLFPCASY